MDAAERKPIMSDTTWRWCFWITLAIILIVFVIPIDQHTYHNGTSEITFHYTIWDKITKRGPQRFELTIYDK